MDCLIQRYKVDRPLCRAMAINAAFAAICNIEQGDCSIHQTKKPQNHVILRLLFANYVRLIFNFYVLDHARFTGSRVIHPDFVFRR